LDVVCRRCSGKGLRELGYVEGKNIKPSGDARMELISPTNKSCEFFRCGVQYNLRLILAFPLDEYLSPSAL